MSPLAKYTLYQLPGAVLAATAAVALWWADFLGTGLAVALVVLWVAKDALLYPWLRIGYETGVRTGAAQLIGRRGVAHGTLAPRGYVRVQGELWRAEAPPEEAPISPGTPVRVKDASGTKLVVERDEVS